MPPPPSASRTSSPSTISAPTTNTYSQPQPHKDLPSYYCGRYKCPERPDEAWECPPCILAHKKRNGGFINGNEYQDFLGNPKGWKVHVGWADQMRYMGDRGEEKYDLDVRIARVQEGLMGEHRDESLVTEQDEVKGGNGKAKAAEGEEDEAEKVWEATLADVMKDLGKMALKGLGGLVSKTQTVDSCEIIHDEDGGMLAERKYSRFGVPVENDKTESKDKEPELEDCGGEFEMVEREHDVAYGDDGDFEFVELSDSEDGNGGAKKKYDPTAASKWPERRLQRTFITKDL